ncbi:hypothetical protein BY458DRAFT_521067 [Sporodiniella umbellata]|nr:hypothetical protein BY458DRAFT_521067 [Sporodiniella umbellata]
MERWNQKRAEPRLDKSSSVRFANNPSQSFQAKPPPKTTYRPTTSSSVISLSVTRHESERATTRVVSTSLALPSPSSTFGPARSHGMSGGAMAGIVIGGVALLAGLGALWVWKRRKRSQAPRFDPPSMEHRPEGLGIYSVAATYTPTLSDEIDIQVGDQVELLVEYDDGWCQGINLSQNTKGVFPKHCLHSQNESTLQPWHS